MNEIEVVVKANQVGGGLDKVGKDAKAAGKQVGDGLEKGFKDGERAADKAVRGIGDGLGRTGRDAKQTGTQVGDGLERGFREGEQASDRARRKIGQDLDKIGEDAKKAGKAGGDGLADMFDFGGAADPAGMLDSLFGSLPGPAAAAGGALGGVIAGAMFEGLQASWAEDKVGGLIAAQTGSTGQAAGRLGTIAGDVFANNFGESIEDVGTAIQAVLQNQLVDIDAPAAEIEKLTELAITASQVVGEEANSIARAARQLLVNGLAGNAEQAIDIIVTASQRGLNVNGDLIDTIVEYSTKFRDLGLDGPQALGLISQAMEAGARDTDFAADALKEFAIRAIDGSETTSRGFKAIGLDAGIMADAIAGGGKRAHDALDLTLDRLRAIEDPVLRDQAAVDLFGTKAEDLGDALFAMDLDTVADKFGDVGGATQQAADTISEATPAIETAWRQLGGFLSDAASAPLDLVNGQVEVQTSLGDTSKMFGVTGEAAKAAGKSATGASDDTTESLERQHKTLEEIIGANSKLAGGVLDLSEAQIRHEEALDKANESLDKNKRNLNVSTEAGRENRSALNDVADTTYDVIEAMERQGATSQEVEGFVASQRAEFIRLATQMGMDAAAANTMADKLGLIPGNYTANVGMNANHFHEVGRGVQAVLDSLSRGVTVPMRGASAVGGGRWFAHGGIVGAEPWTAATGGVRSSGTTINEAGPELVELPSGSRVMTAGATRAMAEAGAFGGGGVAHVVLEFAEPRGSVEALLAEILRKFIRVRGGSVQAVLGS